jgi:hypothetical protein
MDESEPVDEDADTKGDPLIIARIERLEARVAALESRPIAYPSNLG